MFVRSIQNLQDNLIISIVLCVIHVTFNMLLVLLYETNYPDRVVKQ